MQDRNPSSNGLSWPYVHSKYLVFAPAFNLDYFMLTGGSLFPEFLGDLHWAAAWLLLLHQFFLYMHAETVT